MNMILNYKSGKCTLIEGVEMYKIGDDLITITADIGYVTVIDKSAIHSYQVILGEDE